MSSYMTTIFTSFLSLALSLSNIPMTPTIPSQSHDLLFHYYYYYTTHISIYLYAYTFVYV